MKINIEELLKAPALMTVKEARTLIGISDTKIYKDIQDNKLEAYGENPMMIRRDALLAYVGLGKQDIAGFRNPQVVFPVKVNLENISLVLDEQGNFSELWIGEPGEGRLFELIELE